MRLRSVLLPVLSMLLAFDVVADTFSLDSCRTLALQNNKQLIMARQRITAAGYQQKEAFAAYLPAIDFVGGYMYNQKELSLLESDQMLPTKSFNLQSQQYEYNLVKNPVTGAPLTTPDGQFIPETVALIPKEAMTFDIHNVFFGAVTLTQPVYMGGKIKALNQMAGYARQLSEAMYDSETQNVVYAVDAAYWQVVSLKAKYRLALSYVELLDSLDHNVEVMLQQGVATRSNKLSVDVKLNSARVDLIKVENGLTLSRMALAQLCGLPVDSQMSLVDEDLDEIADYLLPTSSYDMSQVYDDRKDLRALRLGIDIAEQKTKVARSAMMPNLALMGAYTFSNPNMFNGFSKRFDGGFSVGAMLTIPVWHWGGNYYKYKHAQTDETLMTLQLEDSKEKVTLQVSQASFRAQESLKTYYATRDNLASADENLRSAQLAFKEGMSTSEDVMAAQTAWLKANSECIDAMIDVHLCDTYLKKVLGRLL